MTPKFSFLTQTFFFLFFITGVSAQKKETKTALVKEALVLKQATELHLTDAAQPLVNSAVNLASADAWLFFDNLRPSEVLKKYAKSILINGRPLEAGPGGNSRIAIYKQGAVVIPHTDKFQALEAFTGQNFGGSSAGYSLHNYYSNKPAADIPAALVLRLSQDNNIRSFKLKRGYMATFATEPDGMGYSQVFIADTADLILPELPAELDQKISYVRIFAWQWPSKKGWCGGRGDLVASNGMNRQDHEIALTQSTWFYSWGVSDPANSDAEFVPMKWGKGGSMEEINSRTDATHLLGFNEPNRPDQSQMTVEQALEDWPKLMESGLRLGSPSVSDNSRLEDWLYKFIRACDEKNYRVDYVTVHAYWGTQQMPSPSAWYKQLREIHLKTGRPIWLTEWNNGANWTKEPWPSTEPEQQSRQLRDLKKIIQILDTASFIERYSIYNWVEDKRAVIIDNVQYTVKDGKQVKDKLLKQTLTPAGEFYRDNKPGFAYDPLSRIIHRWKPIVYPVTKY